jgi:hypothetical protein
MEGAPLTITKLSALDLKATWNPDGNFMALLNAGRSLGCASSTTPEEAGLTLLSACASCGHAAFICDYVHQICGNTSVSSTSMSDISLLDGDLVQHWLSKSIASLTSELDSMCTTGGHMTVEPLLAVMRTCVLAYIAVNNAMRSAGLEAKTISGGA